MVPGRLYVGNRASYISIIWIAYQEALSAIYEVLSKLVGDDGYGVLQAVLGIKVNQVAQTHIRKSFPTLPLSLQRQHGHVEILFKEKLTFMRRRGLTS